MSSTQPTPTSEPTPQTVPETSQPQRPRQTKLPIQTQHCRCCNHLLLATTRDLTTLPRRKSPAADAALILPLEKLRASDADADADDADVDVDVDEEQDQTQKQNQSSNQRPKTKSKSSKAKHLTLILSTTIPDRRATLIRREDGIEKRILLRCGRCRVVVGYYLDRVHWVDGPKGQGQGQEADKGEEEEEGEDKARREERPPAMYVLPGALVATEKMGGEGIGEKEWRVWAGEA